MNTIDAGGVRVKQRDTKPGRSSKTVSPARLRLRIPRDIRQLALRLHHALRPEEARLILQRLEAMDRGRSDERTDLLAFLSEGKTYTADDLTRMEAVALVRRLEDRASLLKDTVKTHEVAKIIGRSRQAVHDRVKSNTLLAIPDGHELRFPLWQFDKTGMVVDGLPNVLKALAIAPLDQARWLTSPSAVLDGRTPLEALRAGEEKRVLSEAYAALGEM